MRVFAKIFALLVMGMGILSNSWVAMAQDQTMSWGHNLAAPTWNPQRFAEDSLITSYKVTITNVVQGTVFDVCSYGYRDSEPTYPAVIAGYSENLCWHISKLVNGGTVSFTVNLADTPLFYPKGTLFSCAVGTYEVSVPDELKYARRQQSDFSCEISYHTYNPGEKRFRSLRLPYTDMGTNADGSLPVSYYASSSTFPLKVRKIQLFQSFGGAGAPAYANPCLRWVHNGGAEVDKLCLPTQQIGPGDYDSYSAATAVNWDLPPGDLLTASCQNTAPADCALFALVQIPDNLANSAEAVFRDYNNVPPDYLNNFCQQYSSTYTQHPYYCNGQTTCDLATKVQKCKELFPPASCLATSSCIKVASDLNGDGIVNIFDYNKLVINFGNPYTTDDVAKLIAEFGK